MGLPCSVRIWRESFVRFGSLLLFLRTWLTFDELDYRFCWVLGSLGIFLKSGAHGLKLDLLVPLMPSPVDWQHESRYF